MLIARECNPTRLHSAQSQPHIIVTTYGVLADSLRRDRSYEISCGHVSSSLAKQRLTIPLPLELSVLCSLFEPKNLNAYPHRCPRLPEPRPSEVLCAPGESLSPRPGVPCVTSKIAILTEIIAPYRIPVFNALAERLDLHVIFLSETDPGLRQWNVYKDEIKFKYEVLPSWRFRLGRHNVLLNRDVRSALDRISPNVVLCGGYNYLASWTAARWARRHRVPFLLWSESTAFDHRHNYAGVELLKKRFLNLCTSFVVPGISSLNYLTDYGIAPERIITAPNAVDISLYAELAEAARRNESGVRARHHLPARYFLYVGRLVKAKGVFDLLEAYTLLKPDARSNIALLFAGDGADHRELQQRASRIHPGTIQFLGFKHREELPEIYAMADVLVFPTHTDPWGLVVNEAMACCLPVIATNVAGCTLDLVQDGWNGFVISPHNAIELATAMAALAEDSDLRQQMGLRSSERIEASSPTAWAEGIVRAVKSVVPEE
jgi:glycosyltransferase involved in cell wall biosynthesis